ncbi:hypothetical protein CN878_15440 [Ochrobactrum sp. 695/2009]|nr:hypothetical protein CN881_20670 [Ochrobactrum sp. 721/2009]PJT14371.1 hypothetical protein CN880_17880 [Ochrobactrum sp. 720/2009]PJT28730.1 hypothetical protein CN878_15440 [Ochrobactrum sp. 695/2009]PJT34164.1 hypothetical protein CN877_11375 [Ochrobactrum sp. 689/2009]
MLHEALRRALLLFQFKQESSANCWQFRENPIPITYGKGHGGFILKIGTARQSDGHGSIARADHKAVIN